MPNTSCGGARGGTKPRGPRWRGTRGARRSRGRSPGADVDRARGRRSVARRGGGGLLPALRCVRAARALSTHRGGAGRAPPAARDCAMPTRRPAMPSKEGGRAGGWPLGAGDLGHPPPRHPHTQGGAATSSTSTHRPSLLPPVMTEHLTSHARSGPPTATRLNPVSTSPENSETPAP